MMARRKLAAKQRIKDVPSQTEENHVRNHSGAKKAAHQLGRLAPAHARRRDCGDLRIQPQTNAQVNLQAQRVNALYDALGIDPGAAGAVKLPSTLASSGDSGSEIVPLDCGDNAHVSAFGVLKDGTIVSITITVGCGEGNRASEK
jgi:hypothetical protein